jgi:hypothetical protein
MQYNERTLTSTLTMQCTLWGRKVFCNWAYNLVFELQWPFVTHYIFTPINAFGQVTWVANNAIHYTCDHTLVQLNCNFVATTFFNYYATLLRLQP